MSISFDDLDQDPNTSVATDVEAIRKAAHIANGGEASFPCPKCNGTGQWRAGYPCFACKRTGKVSKGVIAAAKGKETKQANEAQWAQDHKAEIEFIVANSQWSDFYRSLHTQYIDRKKLSDGQINAIRNGMAKAAEKKASKEAEKAANSGTIELSAIDQLFATAKASGLKKPIWRASGLEIHTDRQYGVSDLWIKDPEAGGYVGKVVDGKFMAFRRASENTLPTLKAIAADPFKAALAYAGATNRCACCGLKLKAGISVVAAIGPICAENWGLTGFREAAAEAIAAGEV